MFDLIHLYSIPDKNNLTIIPKSTYLALGNDEYTYLKEACDQLTDDIQLCNTLETKRTEDTEDCIVSLVQHRRANCTYAKMNTAHGKIQKIGVSSWLMILKEEQIIRTECNSKSGYSRAAGVVIISLTEDCKVYIMNTTLISHTSTLLINEPVPLPTQEIIPEESVKFELQLDEISLDNIHALINRVNDISTTNDVDWPLIVATPSWTTLLLYIVLIAIIAWKIIRRQRASANTLEKTVRTSQHRESSEDATRSSSCFRLKEGGVTMA